MVALQWGLPMIIVTGTKRSGTSMWMQILTGAGFPAFGEAFPRNWDKTLKDANPDGFYESILRQGIYYRTNPHPQSGAFFHPSQVTRHVVKVFIPGLVRTDRVLENAAHVDAIIAVSAGLMPVGTQSASEAQIASDTLRPLASVVRSARIAAVTAVLQSAWI